MTISPISYSNYQNTINIRKNNNLQNNPQIPENQVAFKGLEKVATSKVVTKNSNKIFTTLTAFVLATMASLGIKTKEEKAIQKNFDTILNTTMFSNLKESNPDLYKKMLKTYSDKPELVGELMNKYISFEHLDCNHDRITKYYQRYSCEDIMTIYEIDKINPALTPLAKKAFGGEYYSRRFHSSPYKAPEMRAEIKKAILNEPEKVEIVLKELEKTKVFYDYSASEDYYTVEALLEGLREYETKQAAAFAEAKQKAEEKFGIEITKVCADSNPSKGDDDYVRYIKQGQEQIYYLPAPHGGRTETGVLEAFMKKYNNV